jgi:DNA-binding sugar fermentation-stimulating protein
MSVESLCVQIKSPYVADVQLESGEMTMAHCPSLDCAGLIQPGKQLLMTPSPAGSKAATSYAVRLVAEAAREGCEPSIVGAHPMLAEKLAQSALSQHLIPELGSGYELTKQKTYGNCRVDFVLTYEDGSTTLVEVKNVTGADYGEEEIKAFGATRAQRANKGCYEGLAELGSYRYACSSAAIVASTLSAAAIGVLVHQ